MPHFRTDTELHAADMIKAVGAVTLKLLLQYAKQHVSIAIIKRATRFITERVPHPRTRLLQQHTGA